MTRYRLFIIIALLGGCNPPAPPSQVEITDFRYPWVDQLAPSTIFYARTEGDRLHFRFVVEDQEVIVEEDWAGEETVIGEDRVEIFLARDEALNDYWCFEIDPLGRVLDYHASHYRVFDFDWNFPDLQVEGQLTDTGYEVAGSIGLQALGDLLGQPVTRGSSIRIGLFRGEFYGESRGELPTNWISWVQPTSPKPDFHIPSAFQLWEVP